MNKQHDDERLNREILEIEQGAFKQKALIEIGFKSNEPIFTKFKLTVPYKQSINEPDKVLPISNWYNERKFWYDPKTNLYFPRSIEEFIQETVQEKLRETLFGIWFKFIALSEITRTIPRIYEEYQVSLNGRFRLNAYQIEGKLECKI